MRAKHRLFISEGEKCTLDTLGAFRLEWLVATPSWLEANSRRLPIESEKILTAPPSLMAKISSLSSPPEVMAVFAMPEEETPVVDEDRLYLMLDGVQDPGNLGTIVRTADWFGIDTIFASHDTVDLYNPKTVQSTMGSLKRVKVVYADLADLISAHPGMPVFGTLLEGNDIYKTPLGNSGFIIMGNEGNGISPRLRECVTDPLLIPPFNKDSHPESLNVAIATAVTLACFRRD